MQDEDDDMVGNEQGRAEAVLRNEDLVPVSQSEKYEEYEGLSALAQVASDPNIGAALPTPGRVSVTHGPILGEKGIEVITLEHEGEQRAVRVRLKGSMTIDVPFIGEFIDHHRQQQQQVAFCPPVESDTNAYCTFTPHYNPILSSILGSRTGESQSNTTPGEQETYSSSSLLSSFRTKSEVKFEGRQHSGTTTKGDPLLHSPPLRLTRPTITSFNRRPAPTPIPLTSRPNSPYFIHYTSSSLSSPRHSPYLSLSAKSVPIPIGQPRFARSISGGGGGSNSLERTLLTSMSPYSPSTPPPPPPDSTSSDNSPSSRSGQRTPIASPPASMSFSKRRRAPEWPSPRTNSRTTSDPSVSVQQQQPISAFSRDLSQTMHTPAVLRVPSTPVYSPAFYRSGLANQPPPLLRAESSPEPLHPRHTPFNSAPPLTATRLEHPRPPSPSPNNQGQAQGKRGRVNLMGIPKGWVIEQLNKRAGQYWHDPSSSDVRILVPIPRSPLPRHSNANSSQPLSTGKTDSAQSYHSNQPDHALWPMTPQNATVPAGNGEGDNQGLLGNVQSERGQGKRRGSLPGNDDIVALVFPLHQDYLLTQSSLCRQLLSPSSAHIDSPRTIKGARLLPTPPGAPPAIYLPLPDPPSFSVLVHWFYWGDTTALESALSKGLVEWQGVVKNVHQLGMDDGVKRVLGRWWRRWTKTDEGRARARMGRGGEVDEDEDDEEELRDEEGEGDVTEDEERGMMVDHSEPGRGRVGDDEDVSKLLRAL